MKGEQHVDVRPLFEPVQIKNKLLRNRIVMAPMVVNRGLTTAEAWQWYGRRARGGVGMVIVEASDVIYFGNRYTVDGLRPLADAIHQGGAAAAIQIFPGRRGERIAPADLSLDDIKRLLDQYRVAAEICAAAGFDGIEPHGAHGYLLNRFFSPNDNTRTDAYGADDAGRSRLALEIMDVIRPIAHQAGMLLLYRHTPVRLGYGIAESLVFAEKLIKAGVDVLDISPASELAPADRAAPFMALGKPVIAVNLLDQPERALEAINEKRATLVAIGRGLIADPDLPNKVRAGHLMDIVGCIRCDQCHADLRAGEKVGCQTWGAQEP
jgi:2,4-dienoyl-CoA reductase-like NADH-dependent reductase (Old Yellow Enzyme family)